MVASSKVALVSSTAVVAPIAKPTFGTAMLQLASMPSKLSSGALGIAHNYSASIKALVVALHTARRANSDDSVRDTMLQAWFKTPEGKAHVNEKNAMPAPKLRTDTQKERVNTLKDIETAVANQLERACDVYSGLAILRTTRLVTVHCEKDVYSCFVRSEKLLKEMQNFAFNTGMLQRVPAEAKHITAKTSTKDIVALVSNAGRSGAPGQKPGGAVERIDQSKMGAAFKALDVSMTAYVKPSGELAVSPAALAEAKRVFGRLYHMLSDQDRYDAINAFKADADKAKTQTKAVQDAANRAAATATANAKTATVPQLPAVAKTA